MESSENIVFGKYRLLKKIAMGGMAEVFLAHQTGISGFEKLIIIKKILKEFNTDEEFIHMFMDEARISGFLNHPNVAQVYETGSISSQHYLAMEFIDGKTLKDLMELGLKGDVENDNLPLGLGIKILSMACLGLDYAHSVKDFTGNPIKIIHRDISPHNIMISIHGNIKIIDFGIAKATVKHQQTSGGTIKGKYGYMSPEQIKGENMDFRSDLFSVGIILYELAKGGNPFEADQVLVTMDNILHKRISEKDLEGVDEKLKVLIIKSLDKDPNKRYQNGSEFHQALEEYLINTEQIMSQISVEKFMRKNFSSTLDDRELQELLKAHTELTAGSMNNDLGAFEETRISQTFPSGTPPPMTNPSMRSSTAPESSLTSTPILTKEEVKKFSQIRKNHLQEVEEKSKSSNWFLYFLVVVLLAQGVYFFLDPSILEDVFGESQQAQQPEQGAKNFKVISNNGVLQLEVLPRNSKITVHGKEGGTLWKKLPVGLPLKIKIEAANFQVFETELVLTPEKLERRIPVALRPLSTSLYAKIKFSSSSIQNAKILLDGNIISRSMPTEWFTLTPFEYHTVDIATISKSYQTILGPFPPSCKVLVKYNQNQGGALVFSEININFDPKDKDLKLFWLKGDKQKLLCSEACQAPQYLTGVPPFDLAVINADGKTVKQQKVENSNPIDFIP